MQTVSTLRVAFELLSLFSERYVLQFLVASVLYYSNAEHVYSNTNVLSICVCVGGKVTQGLIDLLDSSLRSTSLFNHISALTTEDHN